jgi:hypothetical protein
MFYGPVRLLVFTSNYLFAVRYDYYQQFDSDWLLSLQASRLHSLLWARLLSLRLRLQALRLRRSSQSFPCSPLLALTRLRSQTSPRLSTARRRRAPAILIRRRLPGSRPALSSRAPGADVRLSRCSSTLRQHPRSGFWRRLSW